MAASIQARREQGGPFQGEGTHHTLTGAAFASLEHDTTTRTPDYGLTVGAGQTQQQVPQYGQGMGNGPQVRSTTEQLGVLCGPLLNYRRMSGEHTESPVWHGSVLLVTTPGQVPERLSLRYLGSAGNSGMTNGHFASLDRTASGTRLYEDPHKAFWQFDLEAPFQDQESAWEYSIPRIASARGDRPQLSKPQRFFIPSKHESMRIMFHSCNGFSVGTDEEAWSGPALWNDVLRLHNQQPFHVMIGGGDQIYNDGVRVNGPLRPWTDIANLHKRREYPFNEEMRAKCDEYYFENYVRWYSTEPFASANGRIPQLNVWDDHDIIDGFGSYTDHFMRCPVFRGIGGVAHKYYMLFQHHIPPPVSTFTTDAPQTMHGQGADSVQLKDTYVLTQKSEDPSYIIGKKPGPYVEERSRSIYTQLGARIAFLGLDARTERTRHQINYPETYDLIFQHTSTQIAASRGAIKHLILLLGVPIAYPRLQWLENILQSPIIGPIRFLNKHFGVAGGFFNQFDGGVDLLDDLDDHYTGHQHKKERKMLVERLQTLAKDHSIRISILGGDVHLAALGRFYSNPKLSIPAEKDWRYVPNIISSAITNKPPPQAVANLLARRNKVHHLDRETDETLLELFDRDPGVGMGLEGVKAKTAEGNRCTMPSRNYAVIWESCSHVNGNGMTNGFNGVTNGVNGTAAMNGQANTNSDANTATSPPFHFPKNPREPLHSGEQNAGTTHPAASGMTRTGLAGVNGLDVTMRVEINPSDHEGRTQGYGFSVPALDSMAYVGQGEKW